MASAIACGAFGAHGLKRIVSHEALAWWDTAATYHRAHALGLMIIALLWPRLSNRGRDLARYASISMMIGISLFSGSLYAMTLTEIRILGAITPIGGSLLIFGWVLIALAVKREDPAESSQSA
jgi:uncharacterized membrane protein YgdD (TMEM256/DUF423 family)